MKTIFGKINSLRFYIILLILFFGLVPVVCYNLAMADYLESDLINERMIELKNAGVQLTTSISNVGYTESMQRKDTLSNISLLASIYEGRILLINSKCKVDVDTYMIAQGKTTVSKEVLDCFQGKNYSNYSKEKNIIEFVLPVSGTSGEVSAVFVVSSSTKTITEYIKKQGRWSQMVFIAIFIILTAFSIIIGWAMLKPFKETVKSIKKIQTGDLSVVLPERGYRELAEITDSFNEVIEKLKILDESRQEFVSNASHELKTPMAAMRIFADSIISSKNVSEKEYKEFMTDIRDEIVREDAIINDLLQLVKLDKTEKEATLNIKSVNIELLTKKCLRRLYPIAEKRNIEIYLACVRPVTAEVDETKMSLVITNLIENAIKYNKDNGNVTVTIDADHKYFYLKVTDTGVGIAEDEQALIFERFYRVDKARSRDTGGTGLGLAISKAIIGMHKGSIKVTSELGEGSVFTVRVPLVNF